MMNRLSFLLCSIMLWMVTPSVLAQMQDDDQLLIYHHSGAVTLLYQSQTDSIFFTHTDTLGNYHDEPIAQVFYTKDTALWIAIADIDSVCFGSRNVIQYKSDVRFLATEDLNWIIRFDGSVIYYRTNTPKEILPSVGQKIYYSEMDEIFPYGLSAKATSVTQGKEDIQVAIEAVDYTEIFDEFFYAGSISQLKPSSAPSIKKAGEVDRHQPITFPLEIPEIGSITIDGGISLTGDVVLDIWRKYYHADLTLELSTGLKFALECKENASHTIEKPVLQVKLPVVAAVFQPSMQIFGSLDLKAELALNYYLTRVYRSHLVWTSEKGQQSFTPTTYQVPEEQANQANIDLILSGSIMPAVGVNVDFGLIGQLAGARAKVKFGPEFSGQLGFGMLSDLSREYNLTAYHAAELSMCNKLKLEFDLTHRQNLVWGELVETKIAEYEQSFNKHTLPFFPNYTNMTLVEADRTSESEISMATKVEEPIVHDVETGFQVLEPENDIVIDSVFTDTIKAVTNLELTDSLQGITDTIILPKQTYPQEQKLRARPVFHYAGYTIPFATSFVSKNVVISPIIAWGGNGAINYVAGASAVGVAKDDSTTYHIGFYQPVAHWDTVFHKESPFMQSPSIYVTDNEQNTLLGTWTGQIDNQRSITITFSNDGNGQYQLDNQLETMSYTINNPQSGCVRILLDDGNALVLHIISLDTNQMQVRLTGNGFSPQILTLSKS